MTQKIKKEHILLGVLALLGIFLLMISYHDLFIEGWPGWNLRQKEVLVLFPELLLLFLGYFASLTIWKKDWQRWLSVGILFAGFCWIYVTCIPLFVSFAYGGILFLFGYFIRRYLFGIQTVGSGGIDFLTGSSTILCLICILSALQLGSIRNLRIAALLAGVLGLAAVFQNRKNFSGSYGMSFLKEWKSFSETKPQAAVFSAALSFFCIQVGRMNVNIDYDSIWYGLRSEYVLDPGNGIYENLNLVGAVYTYPKGLECLVLPISGLPSYTFIYSFNIFLTFLCLITVYRIVFLFRTQNTKTMPLFAVLFVSATPAVMNMMVTAKPDTMTLLLQLLMIYFWLSYIRSGDRIFFVGAWMAYFFSMLMKPTAPVFSTAIMGMSLLYLIWERWFHKKNVKKTVKAGKKKKGGHLRKGLLLLPVLGAAFGITMRTLWIVGVPMTSSFGSFFAKMGFDVHYPYRVDQFNQMGSSVSLLSPEGRSFIAKRLFGMFISPSTENMDHVIIAWGGLLALFLMLAILFLLAVPKEQKTAMLGKTYLDFVCLPFFAVSLMIMLLLRKPDGNYFMAFYVLLECWFCIVLIGYKKEIRNKITTMCIPFLLYALVLCVVTNWSMCLGFNEPHLISRQYYQSQMMERVKYQQQGLSEIWDFLVAHPSEKVIGFGEHERILRLPGIMQSYLDVSYWGNSHLTETVEDFMEYVRKTGFSYFVIDWDYEESNCPEEAEWLKSLEKQGITEMIIDEGRYCLVKIN